MKQIHLVITPVIPNNLQDSFLFDNIGNGYLVWQPDKIRIVLGQSNTAENSLIMENVAGDGIPVIKEPTGRKAVMSDRQENK